MIESPIAPQFVETYVVDDNLDAKQETDDCLAWVEKNVVFPKFGPDETPIEETLEQRAREQGVEPLLLAAIVRIAFLKREAVRLERDYNRTADAWGADRARYGRELAEAYAREEAANVKLAEALRALSQRVA